MKKSTIIVMALAVMLSLFSCSKGNHYVVNGEVKEGICPDGEWAYLWNELDHKLLDSVQITNGAFRFEGEVAEPCVAVVKHPFYFNGEKQNVSAAASQFILEAGEINANMLEDIPQPTGTPLNDKLTEIFKEVISTYSAIEEGELSEDAAAEQLKTLFYEQSKEKYPVLYLLHGAGGDEEAWMTLGRTSQILDNLIAQGKAKPMLVVMTNGNAGQTAAVGEAAGGMIQPSMRGNANVRPAASFEQSFGDVIKFVESQFFFFHLHSLLFLVRSLFDAFHFFIRMIFPPGTDTGERENFFHFFRFFLILDILRRIFRTF